MFKPGTGIVEITGLNGSFIHPIVVMNGIKYNHLKHIIDFIYQGEIRVLDSDLEGVLALGESMQVKGLCSVKLRQKLSQTENTAELNPKTDCLKLDSRATTPDKILKPVDNSHSENIDDRHSNAKHNVKGFKLTIPDTVQSIQKSDTNSSPETFNTSHTHKLHADKVTKIEEVVNKPMGAVGNTIHEEKNKLLNTNMSKKDSIVKSHSDIDKTTAINKRVDSTSHCSRNISEHNVAEPTLKKIKLSSISFAPIRTYVS